MALLKRRTSSFAWIDDLRRAYHGSGKEKVLKDGSSDSEPFFKSDRVAL